MLVKNTIRQVAAVMIALASGVGIAADGGYEDSSQQRMIERGRYIARIAGCNDCHTPGYAQSGGQVPEQQWLIGDRLGWRGPWGTTYPANLRIALSRIDEAEWVSNARKLQYRPPMPWFALRDMAEDDLRALYRFVRSLGPVGNEVPAYVPSGQEPQGVAVRFPMPPG